MRFALALLLACTGAARADSPTIEDYAEAAKQPYQPMGGVSVSYGQRCGGPDTALDVEHTQATLPGARPITHLDVEQTRARMPQHDVDLGRSRVVLRVGDKVLAERRVAELWECLEYMIGPRRYVLTSTNEHGTQVSLRALVYLDARDGSFHDSVFDEVAFEAMSSRLGPDGRWLALVGTRTKNQDERPALFVLDLVKDKLIRLGPAPDPPPMSGEEISFAKDAIDMSYAWDAPERAYAELEPHILRFVDANTLEVSYGKDSARRRAKQRRVRRYALDPT